MNYTACTRRNQITCENCEEVIESRELKRTVQWGTWDSETQNFERQPRQEHYCEDCWRDEWDREAAAYHTVTDSERFWDILAAADGTLVADLRPIFVGGRAWIRVVDGELQGMQSTREMDRRPDPPVVKFGTEPVDIGRGWFDETFEDRDPDADDGPPQLALLKPADETPFVDYEPLPDDQATLEDAQNA